jgi:hypothetical protein
MKLAPVIAVLSLLAPAILAGPLPEAALAAGADPAGPAAAVLQRDVQATGDDAQMLTRRRIEVHQAKNRKPYIIRF